MKYLIVLFLSFSFAHATEYPLKLGNTTVKIAVIKNGPGKTYIHLHQNEKTALKAAKTVLKANGGTLITLIHKGNNREVSFSTKGHRYTFDPNRIFTDSGIRKTLTELSEYTPDAHHQVKKLANKIVTLLPNGKVVAVHNNEYYSLKNYLPGHKSSVDASAMSLHSKNSYRNFYVTTHQHDYFRLKKLYFNTVLQKTKPRDDGSLSVYLAGKHYINVEAGYDQLPMQIKMIKRA